MIGEYFGFPIQEENIARGCFAPPNPILQSPLPLSITTTLSKFGREFPAKGLEQTIFPRAT